MATPACAAQRAGRGPAARPKQACFSTSQRPWRRKLPACACALSFWAEEAAVWLLTVLCLGLGAREGYLGFFQGRGTTWSPRWPNRTASLPWDQACRPPTGDAHLRSVAQSGVDLLLRGRGQWFWFSSPSCCGKPRSLGDRWGYPGLLRFSSCLSKAAEMSGWTVGQRHS